MTRPDPYPIVPCALLDAAVVRDIAVSLDGRWSPDDEAEPGRRADRLGAARLRLYGERDRSGFHVVTYGAARDAGLAQYDADWSVGFLSVVDDFEDAPAEAELLALMATLSSAGLDAEERRALAWALLYEPIQLLVTTRPRGLHHDRDHDLPARLELVDPAEAFDRFGIATGEAAPHAFPDGHPLSGVDPWWVP